MSVLIQTSKGDFTVDLFYEKCPKACQNFISLCLIKYYNNNIFFNIQKGFMIQTGDPTNTGKGGESIYGVLYGNQAKYFEDEFHDDLKHNKKGLLSYANVGKNTNASQFFITTTDRHLDYLDGKHTIFGEVVEGIETVMKINNAYTDENGRPLQVIRILHTVVLIDPWEDKPLPNLKEHIPAKSPELKELKIEGMLGENEDIELDKQTDEQMEEIMKKREARSKARVLAAIGDIPHEDIKPPENVLFVCKLNPATQDEDLELIFSRFGKINSCEIIRDRKTGESLCYAFIEFEKKESCEEAYFKMENVLIDDRRIHVDFSQSVSKLWNRHRRGGKMPFKIDPSQWEVDDKKKDNIELKIEPQVTEGYIFDESDTIDSKKERKKRRRSKSPDERKKRKRSRSPDERKRRRRSRSPDERKKRNRSRSPYERKKRSSRSRSPEERHKKHRSKERRRSSERSRERDHRRRNKSPERRKRYK